jgi:hypothetical protein
MAPGDLQSTRRAKGFRGHVGLGTDFWAMHLDGSGNKRLTAMNLTPTDPQSQGAPRYATTSSVSPSGDFFHADVQESVATQNGMALLVRFTRP